MRKIRFGVVGTNFITDWVIAGAREDNRFELAAVCSRTEERAAAFAARHGIPHTFTSIEDMAASDLVDAVYIATPNSTHARYALCCMAHGKHVLCEKPFASNAREAREMAAASKKYGVTLMEAMKPTLTPNFLAIRDALRRAGTIRRYFSAYCQYSSRYDRFKAGELPNAFNPALSNGSVMDIGVYTIYPMVVLFGRPESVSASSVLLRSGADGQGAVNFSYPGMTATVLYSKIADSSLPTEIEGEEGNIVADRINRIGLVTWQPRAAAASGKGVALPVEELTRPVAHDEYYYEVAEFIDLILSGRRESSVNSHFNSVTVMEIVDEIRREAGIIFPADREE